MLVSALMSAAGVNEGETISGMLLRPGRVLVVDDDALVARAIALVLGDEHEVVVTTEPLDALDRIARGERYDVILCDLMMPGTTGMELHRRVAACDPGAAARIVFVTGCSVLPEAQAFLASVPNTCLEKPFDLKALRDFIGRRVRAEQPAVRAG